MSENYEAPSPYAAAVEALRTTEENRLLGAVPTAHAKIAADAAKLRTAAINYSAEQIAKQIIEREAVDAFDRAAAKAAEELGVPVSQLRLARDGDDTADYTPPSAYAPALAKLRNDR